MMDDKIIFKPEKGTAFYNPLIDNIEDTNTQEAYVGATKELVEENKDLEIQVSTPEPPKLEIVKDDIPLFLKIIMVVGIAGWFGIIVDLLL